MNENERGRPFIVSTATGRNSANRRFKVWSRTFYRALSYDMEEKKQYEVRCNVEGIGSFIVHHVKSDKPYVFLTVRKDLARFLELGRKYRVTFESVRERTDYRVIVVAGRAIVKIPGTRIEASGLVSESPGTSIVVELAWQNISRAGEPVRRSFFTYTPSSVLDIHLDRAGAAAGDIFRLLRVRRYQIDDFVKDFRDWRGHPFSNVGLAADMKRVFMTVDGRRFVISAPHLTAFGLEVAMTGRIEPTMKEVTFRSDGSAIEGSFFAYKKIVRMRALNEGLEIVYHTGPGDERTFHVYLDRFDKSRLYGQLKLVSPPHTATGHYLAEVAPEFAAYVRSRLASSSGTFRWSREKGDIAEEVVCKILELSGFWKEVARHPFDGGGWKLYDSNKLGPDSVLRLMTARQLSYFELKWWEKFKHQALRDARKQVAEDLLLHPCFRGERVGGAFIGILEWDTRRTEMKVFVERVR